ncbi:MAG: efflux RND transporter periplasmic adaptor subunit [Pseudomonadales bacterium]|nr:efflux RND transporter periplasmic adaptor subunit [Pseudomonadales bacterium]
MKKFGILLAMLFAFGGGIAFQVLVIQQGNIIPSADNTSMTAMGDQGDDSGEKKPLYWVAPMDKNYRRDKPGKSPMGMDLVPVYEDDQQSEAGSVKISPVVMNNLGVRTEKVSEGRLEMPINTVGYVAFDEDKLNHIHSRVDGWIEVLNVTSNGDRVKKGETLYELYSPALVNAQEEYLAALRSGNKSLYTASRSRLLSLGLTDLQIKRLESRRTVEQKIKVNAERDGIIKDLNVREGMFIKPATEVMSIGTLDSVWVIAEVFERQSNWVKTGQAVEMHTDAVPGKVWKGTVDYLYPVLDSKTRTLKVRIRVDNSDLILRPNMYANLTIFLPVSEQTLSIPKEALIKSGRYHRVVKSLGDGLFKSVIVKVGIESGDSLQILEGLEKGDEVVTSAQFLIDSESNIDAEIARMESRESNQGSTTDLGKVTATGKLNSVMTDMRMLSITHDPIEAWEWPTMKMDFPVAEDMDLSMLEAGQIIEFELQKQGDWEYLVTDIVQQGKVNQSQQADMSVAQPTGKSVMATGKVKEHMDDMIIIVHDPIPEWNWPVMSMTFVVADPEKLPLLKTGDQVRFKLTELEDGDYSVSAVQKR